MKRWLVSLMCGAAVVATVSISGAARAHAEGGTITGEVRLEGQSPEMKPINFGAEKQCALLHTGHPPMQEDLVVNANGSLRDVLVHITDAVPGTFQPTAEPFVFDQHGCLFHPRVGAVMAGQPVEVRNNDPVLHNVRAQSKLGQSFNIAQPVQGMKTTRTLRKPEIGIPLKCDVHFWMLATLHVLAQPFFAVTNEAGTFTITGLPPGTYTVEARHEKLGTKTLQVTVGADATAPVTFTFQSP